MKALSNKQSTVDQQKSPIENMRFASGIGVLCSWQRFSAIHAAWCRTIERPDLPMYVEFSMWSVKAEPIQHTASVVFQAR